MYILLCIHKISEISIIKKMKNLQTGKRQAVLQRPSPDGIDLHQLVLKENNYQQYTFSNIYIHIHTYIYTYI